MSKSTVKKYTLEQVATHNSDESLWVIIHGRIYDLTDFQYEHPGGMDSIFEQAGKDGTTAFDNTGHSDGAKNDMLAYEVGIIKGGEADQGKNSKAQKTTVQPNKPVSNEGTHHDRPHTWMWFPLYAFFTLLALMIIFVQTRGVPDWIDEQLPESISNFATMVHNNA